MTIALKETNEFVVSLLQALGIPTHNLIKCVITVEAMEAPLIELTTVPTVEQMKLDTHIPTHKFCLVPKDAH